jgi:hypothetical protein
LFGHFRGKRFGPSTISATTREWTKSSGMSADAVTMTNARVQDG